MDQCMNYAQEAFYWALEVEKQHVNLRLKLVIYLR